MALFFVAFLSGVMVGDLWSESGVCLIVFLVLVAVVFFWKTWKVLLAVVVFLFTGYILAINALQTIAEQRENLGAQVGWDGHDRTISGTARELLSVSEFSHKYRVTISYIDEEVLDQPLDISVSMPPNLSLMPGDSVTALGRFSFPRDTPEYQAEKQLSNRKIIAEFRSFRIDKTPPEKYGVFVRMRVWFNQQLSEIFPAR